MIRRAHNRLAARRAERLARLEARLDHIAQLLEEERAARRADRGDVFGTLAVIRSMLEEEVRPLLTALAREDAWHRRELSALRASPEYELAYTDPDPLVTIAVATRADRLDRLVERALPSALAQTYANLEVVVVGDAAGDATGTAVESLGDERVRYSDLTQRFVHPDAHRHSLTGAIMPRNEAHRLARGHWTADLDDDDALRPDAVENLLALAREQRLEVAYGLMQHHEPSGPTIVSGAFPPVPLEPDWRERGLPFQPWEGKSSPAALVHAGLRLFAREHVAADLGRPGDFFRLERMLRAGVRFGMLDEIVYDYYPGQLWD